MSTFAQSWPPVHHQTCSITASRSNLYFTRSLAPSSSPNSLDNGDQVYLRIRWITATSFMSLFPWSSEQCRSPTLLDQNSQVLLSGPLMACHKSIFILHWPQHTSASSTLLEPGVPVHFSVNLLAGPKWIVNKTQSRPPRTSPNWFYVTHSVHPPVHTILGTQYITKLAR